MSSSMWTILILSGIVILACAFSYWTNYCKICKTATGCDHTGYYC